MENLKNNAQLITKQVIELLKVRSVITLGLVGTLLIIALRGVEVDEKVFNLLSSTVSAAITFLFTRESRKDGGT